MRAFTVAAATACSIFLSASVAQACEPLPAACLPRVVVFPAYMPWGLRIGTVEALVRRLPRLERSRFTGQPLTVAFNNPGSFPGAVDPYVELVPLRRVPRSSTQAAYPQGY